MWIELEQLFRGQNLKYREYCGLYPVGDCLWETGQEEGKLVPAGRTHMLGRSGFGIKGMRTWEELTGARGQRAAVLLSTDGGGHTGIASFSLQLHASQLKKLYTVF